MPTTAPSAPEHPDGARRNARVAATGSLLVAPVGLGMGILGARYGADPDLRVAAWTAALAVLALGTAACGFAVVAARRPARTAAALAWSAPVLALGGFVHGFARAAGGAGSPLLSVATPLVVGFLVTLLAAAVHVASRSAAPGTVPSPADPGRGS